MLRRIRILGCCRRRRIAQRCTGRRCRQGKQKMRSFKFRSALVALVAMMAAAISPARADSGTITINVFKGGWFVGASGGSGVLLFRGEMYPISIAGLSAGLVFGASQ